MLKQFSLLILILTGFPLSGQDLSATLKTASNAAPGKDLLIELAVTKPGVNGFTKYFQELPTGFTATNISSEGGEFTYADNGAKIIWITPPAADQFTMSYKIAIPSSATGNITLGGKFAYVVGNERRTFEVPQQVVAIGNETKEIPKESIKPAPSQPTTTEPKKVPQEEKPVVKESKPTTPAQEKTKTEEIKKTSPVVNTKPETKIPATAAATTSSGKTYRVQIGAFSQKPKLDGVTEPSSVLLDNGMTKYFSGNFKTYEEAKKRKAEMIEKGFSGAFIVSFENGKIVK
ncbi:MAG: hypothetical protein K0S44_2756 [Bacteroidetes bacterium]|jgi:hypothetical protein|nr:hypothetical protein [Bacteroidota bacterium]